MESLASITRSARSSTEAKRTGLVHSFHPCTAKWKSLFRCVAAAGGEQPAAGGQEKNGYTWDQQSGMYYHAESGAHTKANAANLCRRF